MAPKLKRYDMKNILADPTQRRDMIARSTQFVMAIEGQDITMEESLASYDRVMEEKRKKEAEEAEAKERARRLRLRTRIRRPFGPLKASKHK
jgi:hypothetical protein